jgi:hypothetical protein
MPAGKLVTLAIFCPYDNYRRLKLKYWEYFHLPIQLEVFRLSSREFNVNHGRENNSRFNKSGPLRQSKMDSHFQNLGTPACWNLFWLLSLVVYMDA